MEEEKNCNPFGFTYRSSPGMLFFGILKAGISCRSPYGFPLTKGEMLRLMMRREDPQNLEAFNALCRIVGYVESSISSVLIPLIESRTISVNCTVDVTRTSSSELSVIPCLLLLSAKAKHFDLVESFVLSAKLDFNRFDDSCIFGNLSSEDEAFDPPKDFITTNLLFHQRQGLAWLLRRERSSDLPPFWAVRNGEYVCVLSGLKSSSLDPIRGGVFADDSGLGKTLTFLSLIACDKTAPVHEHRKKEAEYFMGSNLPNKRIKKDPTAVPPKTTLIVSRLPLLRSKWISQINKLTSNIRTVEFHGGPAPDILAHDIVLTTHSAMMKELSGRKNVSAFYEIRWHRIILDEAHTFKAESQYISDLAALHSHHRWASLEILAQNSINLFPLVVFLNIQPFCLKLFWEFFVQRPFGSGCNLDLLRLQELMKNITLRRTKEKDVVGLPTKSVETCFVELTAEERSLYDRMESKAKVLVSNNISSDKAKDGCKGQKILINEISVLLEEEFHYPLGISQQTNIGMTSFPNNVDPPSWPFSRYSLSKPDLSFQPESGQFVSVAGGMSTKVDALLNLLSSSRDDNPATISVVFSHFWRLLIQLQKPLEAAGYKTLCLDGVKDAEMTNRIKEFIVTRRNVPTVLLASFKALGSGINLTAAARVYLMDPCLNLTVEEHVMDSVYRIGQKQDVKIVKIIARHTIEEKLIAVLEEKKKLARGTFLRRVQSDDGELLGIGLDDLRVFFSL